MTSLLGPLLLRTRCPGEQGQGGTSPRLRVAGASPQPRKGPTLPRDTQPGLGDFGCCKGSREPRPQWAVGGHVGQGAWCCPEGTEEGARTTYLCFRRSRRAGGGAREAFARKRSRPGKTSCLTCGGGGEGRGWGRLDGAGATTGSRDRATLQPRLLHGLNKSMELKVTAASMGWQPPWEKAPLPSPPWRAPEKPPLGPPPRVCQRGGAAKAASEGRDASCSADGRS